VTSSERLTLYGGGRCAVREGKEGGTMLQEDEMGLQSMTGDEAGMRVVGLMIGETAVWKGVYVEGGGGISIEET